MRKITKMTPSLFCFRSIAALQPGQSAVLATVIRVRGSVPREVGAKLVVTTDGHTVGTIGGGAGEAKVLHQAIAVLTTGQAQMVTIDLSGIATAAASPRPVEGICGGQMQVWLQRWSGPTAIALAQTISDRLQAGQPTTLVTPLTPDAQPYLATTAPPSLPEALVETLQPPPALLIVGAGHCGLELARVADQIGFQVMVQDERPDWANPDHYPQTVNVMCGPLAIALDHLANHAQLYAALVTRGFQYDVAALEALLKRQPPCPYIGTIGSRRRIQQVFQALQATGIPAPQLATVHGPIGLDIGALTPAEIAVSIAAELVLVRRGGTGRPLAQLS